MSLSEALKLVSMNGLKAKSVCEAGESGCGEVEQQFRVGG
jgi:hypothetical protein